MSETMLRAGNVKNEEHLEAVRDALDELGADYEHVDSEPDEDSFPRPRTSRSNRTSPTTPTTSSPGSQRSMAWTPRSSEGRQAACRVRARLALARRCTVL
jgi:hypothetical protein